ncbi:MAG: hypothetical protein K8I29_18040 [Alphaproteobacteria bacterium]|uniref:Uncharacterized protein n=1 Tax=Candidatus Nitrobium versatile TaxID=2884831 RepID=A0A953M346_9BACT|nr:hypothetical protein [Candidatus Nitrobium versatile]
MSPEELRKELEYLRECLLDLEETYAFHLTNTSAHIGSGIVKAMREEHEEQTRIYREKIARLEGLLRGSGAE